MTETTKQYEKIRSHFGRDPRFEEGPVTPQINIAPKHETLDNFELRDPIKIVLDNIPKMSEHSVSSAKNE